MTEDQLHKQICEYIKYQYPDVLFNTDMSGFKLTIGQAKKAKSLRSSSGFPDIVIYRQSTSKQNNNYSASIHHAALFLEVKKETPYKKDGTLKKSMHLERQWYMLNELYALGYYAKFVWSFDMAKELIDNYLNNRL